MTKPFKCSVTFWSKYQCSEDGGPYKPEEFGDNLGYLITGMCLQHPEFGTTSSFHTSLIIREYEEDEKNMVETLNSTYHLIGDELVRSKT